MTANHDQWLCKLPAMALNEAITPTRMAAHLTCANTYIEFAHAFYDRGRNVSCRY